MLVPSNATDLVRYIFVGCEVILVLAMITSYAILSYGALLLLTFTMHVAVTTAIQPVTDPIVTVRRIPMRRQTCK
jgi:hypothetical protein